MPETIVKLTREVNDSATDASMHWSYEGSTPFADGATPAEDAPLVHRFRLANGLTLLLLVDKSAPVVSYFTWFRVGSRHEKPGKTGLAHFFEHLMFNEAEGLPAGAFDRTLEENGAESNAATWLDWTYYYESLPAESFGLAVKLESARMAKLILREPQVTSEKEVVTNERRMRVDDDVEGAANEILYKTAFTVHPYHWPTIGWMEDIEKYNPEDCAAFYKTYYAPNNATVVVVGDVDEKDVLTQIRDGYGPIPAATLPHEDTQPEPPQMAPREVKMEKPTSTEKILLGWHGPALGDGSHAALSVLNEVLFGGRASRMHRELITKRELCTDVRGWVGTFRDPGLYEMFFTVRNGKSSAELLDVVTTMIERITTDVVDESELVRAKARMELGMLQGMDTAAGKAEQIGFYDTMLGDPAAAFRRLDAYRRVTAGELRTAARRFLVARGRNMVHVVPDGSDAEDGDEGEEGMEEAS